MLSISAVDCGHPESLLLNAEDFMLSGAKFNFLNETTKYLSVAELICPTQEGFKNNNTKSGLLFRCREDGIWTEINFVNLTSVMNNTDNSNQYSLVNSRVRSSNLCVKARNNGLLYFYSPGLKGSKLRKPFYLRDSTIGMLYFLAAVVVAAFFSILAIIVLLFKR